jgi:REP element-mobilizing transposase RayT
MESLLFNNNKQYTIWCATIMSNHVHILLSTFPESPLLNVILQNHKKFTAVHGNKALGRSGKFWAEESYDTIIRDNDHFFRTVHYIINNPVKTGLAGKWNDWKWTYMHPEMKKDFLLFPKTD